MSTQLPHHSQPEQTELAHWFTDLQRKIEPHTNKIVLAVILATIGIVGYQVINRSAAARTSEAWSKYATCTTAESFEDLADDNAGSEVEAWARLEAARKYVEAGVRLSLTNRKSSDENLNNGKTQLDKLLNAPTISEDVREQALSQLAVCLEALSDGDEKPAIEAYEKLLSQFPDSHYAGWAKHRVEELKKPVTSEFYAWFRKAQPAPPERPKPQDAKPGEVPNIQLTPETKPAEGTPPATEAPKTEEKPAETPAAPATPESPAVEKPAEAPSAEKPAETPAAPATEKPAEAPAAPAAPAAETPAPEKPAEPAAEAPKP
ncbi:MAG: hypothetical protein U0929_08445 [Planctomycetaceae bacterium]